MLAHFSRVLIEAQHIGKNTRTYRRAHSIEQQLPPKLELGRAGKRKKHSLLLAASKYDHELLVREHQPLRFYRRLVQKL